MTKSYVRLVVVQMRYRVTRHSFKLGRNSCGSQGPVKYHPTVKGGHVVGFESADGFVVRAGSPASKEASRTLKPPILMLRDQLLELGVLDDSGEQYRFTQDCVFNSPSTAARVIRGYEISGFSTRA